MFHLPPLPPQKSNGSPPYLSCLGAKSVEGLPGVTVEAHCAGGVQPPHGHLTGTQAVERLQHANKTLLHPLQVGPTSSCRPCPLLSSFLCHQTVTDVISVCIFICFL